MKREEIRAIYDQGPEAVIELVEGLFMVIAKQQEQINQQQEQIQKLTLRVKELEDQIAKNSQNSSKPPSSDQNRKAKSLRKKNGKKSGAQRGHEGNTLCQSEHPDKIVIHKIEHPCECGFNLEAANLSQYERRQVFDLPIIKLEVTEHQAEVKECPACGKINRGDFPEGVSNVVQYGLVIKSLIVYLMNYQHIPYRRTRELVTDLVGQSIAEGTLQEAIAECATKLSPSYEKIKYHIKQAKVGHFDETGLYVGGKRFWLHVAATLSLTYYDYHDKRGSAALNEIGILPEFNGRAVHDGYRSYVDYQCEHALCNAHHLRELIFLSEQYDLAWADKMIKHLLKIKQAVDEARTLGKTALDKMDIAIFEEQYLQILNEGFANDIAPALPQIIKRGRKKQSKAKNLLDRLAKYQSETLAFMYDFAVPFDNNLAERDLRMIKVHQKISGSFRSLAGAKAFCVIRSFISSVKKQSLNVFDSIKSIFALQPVNLFSQPE